MIFPTLNFGNVEGLPKEDQETLNRLEDIYKWHQVGNALKDKYYSGKVKLKDVNLGIALPTSLGKLEIGCDWGAKTVDVLAERSMFDGFVGSDGKTDDGMKAIQQRNHLLSEYQKAVKDELKYGCCFAALYGGTGDARIAFYSPECGAAEWDDEEKRIGSGFVFTDLPTDESIIEWTPKDINFYTAKTTYHLIYDGGSWIVGKAVGNKFGRPLIEAMVWQPTSAFPFGHSRLSTPIRRLIDSYVRTLANASIALEFDTTPQKYLLGITDEQYDALAGNKFKQYVGSILLSTTNPDSGQNPVYGQLQQGTITPHVEMMRMLATQFSAATGLSVTDTGVVNDANPTSSDAITAQQQTMTRMAEELNTANGEALYTIMKMARTIEAGTDPETEAFAHFKNPAMPTISSVADAAVKISSIRQTFASTDVFLEMVGFSQADIRRIKAQETRAKGTEILTEELTDGNQTGSMGSVHSETGTTESEGG